MNLLRNVENPHNPVIPCVIQCINGVECILIVVINVYFFVVIFSKNNIWFCIICF